MDNRILQSLDIKSGFVNKVPVKVMRDTGCTTVFVRADMITNGLVRKESSL